MIAKSPWLYRILMFLIDDDESALERGEHGTARSDATSTSPRLSGFHSAKRCDGVNPEWRTATDF